MAVSGVATAVPKNPEANADEALVTTEDEREEDDILFGTGREDRDEVEDDGILLVLRIERDGLE